MKIHVHNTWFLLHENVMVLSELIASISPEHSQGLVTLRQQYGLSKRTKYGTIHLGPDWDNWLQPSICCLEGFSQYESSLVGSGSTPAWYRKLLIKVRGLHSENRKRQSNHSENRNIK